ncbi:hypothetical protein GQX74_000910 [Glossina fuscipes]|nr:hypothetical protein GQX74_000910 [Glossina fuscipes]
MEKTQVNTVMDQKQSVGGLAIHSVANFYNAVSKAGVVTTFEAGAIASMVFIIGTEALPSLAFTSLEYVAGVIIVGSKERLSLPKLDLNSPPVSPSSIFELPFKMLQFLLTLLSSAARASSLFDSGIMVDMMSVRNAEFVRQPLGEFFNLGVNDFEDYCLPVVDHRMPVYISVRKWVRMNRPSFGSLAVIIMSRLLKPWILHSEACKGHHWDFWSSGEKWLASSREIVFHTQNSLDGKEHAMT